MATRARTAPAAAPAGGSEEPATNAHSAVYAALKAALMNGDYLAGDRIVVRTLSEAFATSAMPVREALRRLVAEGALVEHPNRGVIVPPITVAAVADVARVRCVIEGAAAEWAAATMTPEELEEVVGLDAAIARCLEGDDFSDYLTLNRAFHFGVYRASRSAEILTIIERLWLRSGPWLNFMRLDATIHQGFAHHAAILDALRRGDGPAARRAVAADIADAADIIQRAVTGLEAGSPTLSTPRRSRGKNRQ